MIEEALCLHLKKEKIEPVISKSKYKIKFTQFGMDEYNSEVRDDVEVCVRLMVVPDQELCCVEFTRLNGRQTTFMQHFENYKNNVLSFANDSLLKV